ncbi:FliM/FliN family flagellar motor C-terminal domain-containing protein [Chromobacterium sp. S0633]|uniref:FliM/FliN family flagellar motor C-terminal domain-containing protein n=1 Tax=Chromobacterium sp. S0633 TaxID=2957805 RepID=UPI00209E37B4|nr:FliM/FliN family flagellar motor C-terminal domain-containing protein [Chromobacterium sp. S0633]MCP1290384.1 FliM/FliN family flagellar motor C-terminal domain-containing protein [Chromobacterium sp. S0633]
MSVALPYRLYAGAELAQIESRLRERCSYWLRDWSIAEGEVDLRLRPVALSDLAGLAWLDGGEALPAMANDAEADGFFSALCLGVKKSRAALDASSLAGPVLDAARLALGRQLTAGDDASLYRDKAVSAAELLPLYSVLGALCLQLSAAGQTLAVLLSPEQAAGLLPARAQPAALEPLKLRDLPLEQLVELEVRAAPARLSLADLESLQAGDVLRLDQKADGLFELCLPDGMALGRAKYGVDQGRLAVKVVRPARPIKKSET